MPLNWSKASHAHRGDLQVFVCTYPDRYRIDPLTKTKKHDQPWQMRVQTGLRGLKPPLSPPQEMWVGYDDVGLAAVGLFEVRAEEEAFYIRAVARAYRRARRGIADELLSQLLDLITTHPAFVERGFREIYCEIHWKNSSSKKLFKRHGFECIGHDEDLETWAIDLGTPPPVVQPSGDESANEIPG